MSKKPRPGPGTTSAGADDAARGTCGICAETEAIPARAVADGKCGHARSTCGACLAKYIHHEIRGRVPTYCFQLNFKPFTGPRATA